MLQREVAERVTARPGAMSYLSVFVQYTPRRRWVRLVRGTAFEPAPEVTRRSSRWTSALLEERDASRWRWRTSLWRLVQAGFRERRKMSGTSWPAAPVGQAAWTRRSEAAGIAGDRRPQTLFRDRLDRPARHARSLPPTCAAGAAPTRAQPDPGRA